MILVRPKKATEKKVGNIIIPASVKEKSMDKYGIVEAVGAGTKEYDMGVDVGDEILFMDRPNHIEVGDMKLINVEDAYMVL